MKTFMLTCAVFLAACAGPEPEQLAESDAAQQYRGPLEICPSWANDVGYYIELGCDCEDRPENSLFHIHYCQPCKHVDHEQCKPCSGDDCK